MYGYMNFAHNKLLKNYDLFQWLMQKTFPEKAYLDSDIIVMSYPKSGRNWVSFLLANYLSLKDGKDVDIHFRNYSKWVSTTTPKRPPVENFNCPRIVTTHENFKGQNGRKIYLLRHPADVMESYFIYLKDYENIEGIDDFSEFIRSDKYGLKSWKRHVNSIENAEDVLFVKFENLKKSAEKSLEKMCKYMGVTLEKSVIKESVDRSTFSEMKKMEKKYGHERKEERNKSFMRKGTHSKGKSYFKSENYRYLSNVAKKVMKKYGYELPKKTGILR
jgi:hypothetical protein